MKGYEDNFNKMILSWKLAWSIKIKHMESLSYGYSLWRSKVKHIKARVSDEEINRDNESEVLSDLMVGVENHCVIARVKQIVSMGSRSIIFKL